MSKTTQAATLVGMDAHSEKIALCVTLWQHGSEPTVVKNITTTLDAMEATYRRHIPAGSLTVLEASTNAFAIAGRLATARDAASLNQALHALLSDYPQRSDVRKYAEKFSWEEATRLQCELFAGIQEKMAI